MKSVEHKIKNYLSNSVRIPIKESAWTYVIYSLLNDVWESVLDSTWTSVRVNQNQVRNSINEEY